MRGVCGVRAKSPWLLPALLRQMGTMVQLKEMGLFKSQGLIGDEWTDAEDGRTLPVNNPATGEILTSVPFMNGEDTKKAITAASHAFTSWSMRTASDRSKLLRNWFNLLIENKDDLAKLMVLEQGKPLAEAAREVVYGASFVEFFAEEGKRIYGDIIPSPFAEKRMLVMKQPIGVVGAVTPWNFPLAMITRKVAPALAAGCTVFVKPSELTPLTALAAAELALQAGIPPLSSCNFHIADFFEMRFLHHSLAVKLLLRFGSCLGFSLIGVIGTGCGERRDGRCSGNWECVTRQHRGSTAVGKLLMTGAGKTEKSFFRARW